MSFVTREFKFKHVPLLNCWRHLSPIEVHVEGSNPCKQFPLFGATFPVLKLPLVAIDEDSDHSAPSRLCKVLDIVIDLKNDLFVTNFSFDFDNQVSGCVVDNLWICFLVFCVNSFFHELLHV